MKAIHVQAPGLFTTVQDLGREGFGPVGVSPSGAADPISLRLGNRLVGNPDDAAALEMTLLGGAFLFPEGAILALSGSDFGATLDYVPINPWMWFEARPGQTLRLGPTRYRSEKLFVRTRRHRSETFSRQRLDAHLEWSRRLRRQTAAQGRRAEHRERTAALPQANDSSAHLVAPGASQNSALHSRPAKRLVPRILATSVLRQHLPRR